MDSIKLHNINNMNYFLSLISLILLYMIPKTYSQGLLSEPLDSKQGLGISACSYYGRIQQKCQLIPVIAENLPSECTSFVYDGLKVNLAHEITDANNAEVEKYINELGTLEKPVFLFYGHENGDVWETTLADNFNGGGSSAKDEMKSLQTYFNQNKGISGLILKNINLYEDGNLRNQNEQFKMYLETMRSTFSCLSVGVNVIGTQLIDFCKIPKCCYDFKFLDPYLDFYVIDIVNYNPCADEFKCGTYPSKGDEQGYYSLDKLAAVLEIVKIPKDKVYFYFRGSPVSETEDVCRISYSVLCRVPEGATTWCWDTQKGYTDKGIYVKTNGAGFMIENIDLIDPFSDCKCDRPFPAFYFLLDGYNGTSPSAKCPLFDGSCT